MQIFFKFSKFFKIKSFSNHIFSIKSFSKSISFHFQRYLLSINDLIQHFKYVAFSVEKGLMFESYLFLLAKSLIFKIKSFSNLLSYLNFNSFLISYLFSLSFSNLKIQFSIFSPLLSGHMKPGCAPI